jgi:platelet-activating factor acetylhydrolase IB subunit alpha
LLSASRDKTIKIWVVRNARCVVTLTGHDSWDFDLVFHPNRKFLLSSSDDMNIRIWDLTNGRQYRKIEKADNAFVT